MDSRPEPTTGATRSAPRSGRRRPLAAVGGLAAVGILVALVTLTRDDDPGVPEPSPAAAPADVPSSTETTEPTTTTTTTPPPWRAFGIDEPDLPEHTLADWDRVDEPRRVTTAADLTDALQAAGEAHENTGRLQDVVLDAPAISEISETLVVPTGVRLRGHRTEAGFASQVLAAATNFPEDRAMIELATDSALTDLEVDGRDVAWRIVAVSGASDVTVSASHLHGTNSRIGLREAPFEVPGTRPHTDLIHLDAGVSRVLVEGSTLEFAGINPGRGGRGADATTWSAFSTAVSADSATDVTIRENHISETATAGVSVWRAHRIAIVDNVIENVGRNIEWWAKGGPVALGDGITGYNHAARTGDTDDQDFIIVGNIVRNSGNHGLHISGRSIYVADNRIARVQQTDLFFGGTLSQRSFDCMEDLRVEGNTLIDSPYQRGYGGGARLPQINTGQVLVRHYVDATTTPEVVLVEPGDVAGLAPGVVEFATDAKARECDKRMVDE